MKATLTKLFSHQALSRSEAEQVLIGISQEQYPPVQVAAFLTAYQMRSITIAELQGFRDALLSLCVPFDAAGQDTIDIVGTGGDGKNTFNISTLAAIVVAGAGYKVTKHGSYGVSSSVGSSDVLLALGHQFSNDRDTLLRQLDEANICFLHAPLFHPALKAVVPIRRELGMKTFFNMLGPLVNPVQPRWQLFGTFDLELSRLYQYIMQAEEGRRFGIVYTLDGYDEVSLTGPFKWRTNDAEKLLSPQDLGMPQLTQADLHGGDTAEEAAGIFRRVLWGEGTPAQAAAVVANAGLAIQCIRPDLPLGHCLADAEESLLSGRARQVLERLLNPRQA